MPFPSSPSGLDLDPTQRVSVNINGTTCNFWDLGREETYTYAGVTTQGATCYWQCLWQDRQTIAQALLGGSTNVGGTTIYANGWVYPDNPAWLCAEVAVKPESSRDSIMIVGSSGLADYKRGLLTIKFRIPEFSFGSPVDLGEQEVDFSTRVIPLSGYVSTLQFDSDATLCDYPSTYEVTTMCVTQTRYNLASLPTTLIGGLLNCVNSSTFMGFGVNQVLFRGAKSRRKITAGGNQNWDVTYTFEISPTVPYNYAYRAGANPVFQPVSFANPVVAGGSSKMHAPANLGPLLTAI